MVDGISITIMQQLTIDQAGRIVLPKAVRDRFHLIRGTSLAMHIGPDTITLKPETNVALLTRNGPLMVHNGTPRTNAMDAVEHSRRERDQQVHGRL